MKSGMVVVSDIHLGKYKYGKINNETGLDLRTEDIVKNIDFSVDFAIKKKVKYYVGDGDFFHIKRPLQLFRRILASKIQKLLENDIIVILLLGNHDQGKTSGHDLVELSELSRQIPNLHVIEKPEKLEFPDCSFYLLPCVNKIDYGVTDEHAFTIEQIRKFEKIAKEDPKGVKKFFFGHFGTDKSIAGDSFDLGTIEGNFSKGRVVPLKEFSNVWTRVYLGDIHKRQELNSYVRHVGSIARVDFGEQNEIKGFYYFNCDKDEFIEIGDRDFKTLELDLRTEPRETMKKFVNDIQDRDLSRSIVRMKIKIQSSERKLVKFDAVESYLKEVSWNYIGKTILEVDDKKEVISGDSIESLDYVNVFIEYVNSLNLKQEIIGEVKTDGKEILSAILNTQK